MDKALSELLSRAGFLSKGQPSKVQVAKAPISKIVEVSQQAIELSDYRRLRPEISLFSHMAGSSLGGDRWPCSALGCRMKRIQEMSQFAALYSDKVYIGNPFHLHAFWGETFSLEEEKRLFWEDLVLITHLLPLLESKSIELVTFATTCTCSRCLSMSALTATHRKGYEKAAKALRYKYEHQLKYALASSEAKLAIIARGSEDLLTHGTITHRCEDEYAAAIIKAIPKLVARARAGEEVPLTLQQAKSADGPGYFYRPVLDSIASELCGAHFLKTSYLSDSPVEVEFIRDLSLDPAARRRSALMQKYLTCLVPFVTSVNPRDLLKLRQTEQESFLLFRAALSKAVEEYKTNGMTFTDRDAQAVFSDIIQPRLAALDLKLKTASRLFRKGILRQVASWVGSISLGLYTGFLTSNPLAGASAFTAAKLMSEMLESTMTKSDVKEGIRDNEMYFLWRVKELANQSTKGRA